MAVPEDPLQAHRSTPAELQARIAAERGGRPFLVYRDSDGAQLITTLTGERASIGRAGGADVELRWDEEVSRLHAELERIAGEWTVADDGLSRNGTWVNGERISGRHRLRDGDLVRVGQDRPRVPRPGAGALGGAHARRRDERRAADADLRPAGGARSRWRGPTRTTSSRRRPPTRRSPMSSC